MKKKTLLKLISAIMAFSIIFLFYIYNGFMGNPISAKIANSKIKAYAAKTYPGLDLTVSETQYTFKNSAYFSKVQSKTSQDSTDLVNEMKKHQTKWEQDPAHQK